MGRRKKEIDMDKAQSLRLENKSLSEIATDLNISIPTLSRRLAELKNHEGVLTKYRQLQGLQLTSLQLRLLAEITPEKIKKCSLADLIRCFYILKKAEFNIRKKI